MERNFFFGSFMVLLLGLSFSSEEEHDHLYSGGSVKMRPKERREFLMPKALERV